jgi:hypothetical protein
MTSPRATAKFNTAPYTHKCFSCETTLHANDNYLVCHRCGQATCKDCTLCLCDLLDMRATLEGIRSCDDLQSDEGLTLHYSLIPPVQIQVQDPDWKFTAALYAPNLVEAERVLQKS